MSLRHVTEFLVTNDVERLQQAAVLSRERDQSLLKIVNVGRALNHENINLSYNALMVLAMVAAVPGITVNILSENLLITPGGVSKILDQLSSGRVVRGIRQSGLDLIIREPGQGCFMTEKGERIANVIVDALKIV